MSMFHGHKIPEVSAVDAEHGSAENVLLDVRKADEWEAGHAARARSGSRSASSRAARFRLPMNRRIVCVCRSGARVPRATESLIVLGLRRREHGGRHEGVGRGRACRSFATTASPGEVI